MPTRRGFLFAGGGVVGAGLAGVGVGVQRGLLPGRPWLQEHLGLNGEEGVVPDVEPGEVEEGSFVSAARGGVETGWSIIYPPGERPTACVVALHGHGADHRTLVASFGLDRFLAAHVAAGGTPFAVVAADGGTSYWHPRPDGEDASRMVADELLPLARERGLDPARIGLLGWSMGGYGALRLGGLLGPERVAAVCAVSPALWSDPDDASPAGFEDAAEYERESVFEDQDDLEGIPVRVDCGTGDPFYRDVQPYVDGFGEDVSGGFEPGGHTVGYWRRVLPAELDWLGEAMG